MANRLSMWRLHRMVGWMIIVLICIAWLSSRWWYLKWTRRESMDLTTLWLYSGRTTVFVRRGSPPLPRGIRAAPASPVVGPQTTLELLPVSRIGAVPTWLWGFEWQRNPFAGGGGEWTVSLPLWSMAGAVAILTVCPTPGELRRRRGLCAKCGYDLKGNTSGICPECGTALRRRK